MKTITSKAEILIEALPYIQRYEQTIFVIKYGGAAMVDDKLKETFAQDVTLLKKIGIKIVIVHGGGKEITGLAEKLGLQSHFVNGQRYTDEAMMDVVQMALVGKTNKEIVSRINRYDGCASGCCGIDADLLRVTKYGNNGNDLGRVGVVTDVNTDYLHMLLDHSIMPVVAPVGVNDRWETFNINADLAATSIAASLKAEKLIFLSDVEGVMANGKLITSLTQQEANGLIETHVISGGMIPKIESAFTALDAGVKKVHLIDGRAKHSLLLEIFTDEGAGTELFRSLPTIIAQAG